MRRAARQRDGLSREPERGGVVGQRVRGCAGEERPAAQGVPVPGHELVDQRRQARPVAFTADLRDDVAARVDEHQRRPGPGGVGVPRDEIGVVEHGVVHPVALNSGLDGVRVGLVGELGGVHPQHGEGVTVPLLQRTQLVEHPQAVHAAGGPEVEQDDPAPQLLRPDLPAAGTEPAPAPQARGPDPCRRAHDQASASGRATAGSGRREPWWTGRARKCPGRGRSAPGRTAWPSPCRARRPTGRRSRSPRSRPRRR